MFLTLHGASIYESIQRLIGLCPVEMRSEMTTALAQALRLVINQRLVWSAGGTRTPIREWLECTQKIRRLLWSADPKTWPLMAEELAHARQTDFATSIRRAQEEGRITAETAMKHLKELAE